MFVSQQSQFRAYLRELERVRVPLDPGDDAAVRDYAASVKTIRKKLGVPSFTEKLGDLLDAAAEEAPDVRTYIKEAAQIRKELGVENDLGAEEPTLKALADVEKKLGKPLTFDDAKGLSLFQEQMQKIYTTLGLTGSDEDLEEETEFALAKAEIAKLHDEALEKMESLKRRDHLDDINVDIKSLDPRAYL
eukprot:SM000028S10090  [mRNA]  locus=s28:385709:387101:+ [translate_table: standard]